MEKQSSLHQGHRARMRERIANDPESLLPHELLEMLLYYALPRRDTNDLAHTLIEEFGSLAGVLEADTELLKSVSGISDSSALYLRLIGEIARYYTADKLTPDRESPIFDTPDKIATFMLPRYVGLTVERAYLLLFDNGMHLLDCFHVGDGSVSGVMLSTRRIAERAYRKGAAAAILTHNHPGGMAIASKEDIGVTRHIEDALRLLEVPLLEHFVFSDRAYAPIMRHYDCDAPHSEKAASSLCDILKERLRQFGR